MPLPIPPGETPLEAQLRERRVDQAVAAALAELHGAQDEPMLAMMTATKLVVLAAQGVAAAFDDKKALRMVVAFYADLSTRVLRGQRSPTNRLVSES